MSTKYVHVSAALERGLVDRVKEYCKEQDRTKSWVIKKAVESFLGEVRDTEEAYKRLKNPKTKILSSKQFRKKLHV